MIVLLEGKLLEKNLDSVVVLVGGVGYKASVPLSTYEKLPEVGQSVSLLTHLHVREDALQLFGFSSSEERLLFEMVISVTGIGPRLGLAILSSLSVERFVGAVEAGHTDTLFRIPGVGRKTAERMVLELKGRLGRIMPSLRPATALGAEGTDAVAALVSLGFSTVQAEKAVARALEDGGGPDTGELVRRALARL